MLSMGFVELQEKEEGMDKSRHQPGAMHIRVRSWLNSKVGWAAKPNNDRCRKETGLQVTKFTKIRYVISAISVALVTSSQFSAYAHTIVTPPVREYWSRPWQDLPWRETEAPLEPTSPPSSCPNSSTPRNAQFLADGWVFYQECDRGDGYWEEWWYKKNGVCAQNQEGGDFFFFSLQPGPSVTIYPRGTNIGSLARYQTCIETVPNEYYITVDPESGIEPGFCSSDQKPVHVADPINPANGGMYTTQKDLSTQSLTGSLSCSRFYNSLDKEDHGLGVGWRHIFSRSVTATNQSVSLKPYVASSRNSSLYGDQTAACISGFSEVKDQVNAWSNSTATYSNGVCTLTRNGAHVGTLRIYSAGSILPAPNATTAEIEVTRDDGQVLRFPVINGVVTTPPGSGMKLSQTASGFMLTDANYNVEQYDTAGRLLSVTSRAGVVQTMSYDDVDRLVGVTDSFGRRLTLGYDPQNRVISVTQD